jgi:sulfotransferase family protein
VKRRLGRRSASDVEARLVWILGSPRSGTTWLLNLLAQDERVIRVDEPAIGAHLGALTSGIFPGRPAEVPVDRLRVNDIRADAPDYFFSRQYEDVWRPLVRELLLGRFAAQLADVGRSRGIEDPIAVIKEPNGSQGADILMSALPGSRLLFLLRDGRDVVDSELHAVAKGAWGSEAMPGWVAGDRLTFVRERAHLWLCRTNVVERAYEAHPPDLRMRIRYEDLLADTPGSLEQVARWLGLALDREAIERAAGELAFDRLPSEKRGAGQFARAASPGLWRENLSTAEQDAIHEVIGDRLRALGYDDARA